MTIGTTAEADEDPLATALWQAPRPDDPGKGRCATESLGKRLSRLEDAAHDKLGKGWTWRELTLWIRNPTGPDGAPLRDADGAPIPGIPASQSTVRRAIGTPPPRTRNGSPSGTAAPSTLTPKEPRASQTTPRPGSASELSELFEQFGDDAPDRPLNPANPAIRSSNP